MGELTVSPCPRGQKPGANVLSAVLVAECSACPAVQVLWVATLVPKPENGVRIWYKPIHRNPTCLHVGAVRNNIIKTVKNI